MLKPFIKNHYKDIFKDETLFDRFLEEFLTEIKKGYFTSDEENIIIDEIESNKNSVKQFFN